MGMYGDVKHVVWGVLVLVHVRAFPCGKKTKSVRIEGTSTPPFQGCEDVCGGEMASHCMSVRTRTRVFFTYYVHVFLYSNLIPTHFNNGSR